MLKNRYNYEFFIGIPNPPHDCTFTVKNSSAIIFCQVGYHQGDPDIYCYLLRKADNGVYMEHTRSRDACSFIINHVPDNKLNEFWIYSSNKFGHNKDSGVYLTIGQVKKGKIFIACILIWYFFIFFIIIATVNEGSGSKTLILIGSICVGTFFLILTCCICFKMRKGLNEGSCIFFLLVFTTCFIFRLKILTATMITIYKILENLVV
jgi:hypothetical protein